MSPVNGFDPDGADFIGFSQSTNTVTWYAGTVAEPGKAMAAWQAGSGGLWSAGNGSTKFWESIAPGSYSINLNFPQSNVSWFGELGNNASIPSWGLQFFGEKVNGWGTWRARIWEGLGLSGGPSVRNLYLHDLHPALIQEGLLMTHGCIGVGKQEFSFIENNPSLYQMMLDYQKNVSNDYIDLQVTE